MPQSKQTSNLYLPVPANDCIYTLARAAKVMECSERTLADKFRQGEIKASKKLGHWYTTHQNLLAYINS